MIYRYIRVSGSRRTCALCKVPTIRGVCVADKVTTTVIGTISLCNDCYQAIKVLPLSHLDDGNL